MVTVLTPRQADGSGLELMRSSLTVPYAAGMRLDAVPLAAGKISVTMPTREPIALVRLKRPLAAEALVVTGTVGGKPTSTVVFAPFSASGSMLPIFRPRLPAGTTGAGPFTVALQAWRITDERRHTASPSTSGPALTNVAAADLLEGSILQGRFARLLLLATLEKQRAITIMRQVAAARHLELASLGALDTRGRSLGVPRRRDVTESDEHFRARLAMHSRWQLSTPAGFAEALNGPGAPSDKNAGLPSRVGVQHRFRIVEDINQLSVATKLVAVGPDGALQLERFHKILQDVYLFDLDATGADPLRSSIIAGVTRTGTALQTRYFTPLVASCLGRLVRLLQALDFADPLDVVGAYDPDGGSRYELGVGIDIGRLTKAQLSEIGAALPALAGQGGELAQLAAAIVPRPFDDDPLGAWLFGPCGFRTVHEVAAEVTHVSPLPSLGHWIDGPTELPHGATQAYESRYHPSDTAAGIHVRAAASDAATPAACAAAGIPVLPGRLTPVALQTRLTALSGAAAVAPPSELSASITAGVVALDAATFADYLVRVINLDQIVAYPIPLTDLTALGTPTQVRNRLVAWSDALRDAGFYTSRAVWDDANQVLLLFASVSQLPGASVRPGEPPPVTYFWYGTRLPVPVPGAENPLVIRQSRGGKATVTTSTSGLELLVSIGYARVGLADPYEVRIELDDPQAFLDADQYGYLMNLLEFAYPIGIEINTFDIRRSHVDIDGDGKPEFLTSRASRTYFRDRHRRPFGETTRPTYSQQTRRPTS